jgi:hypothetical protein
MKELGLCLVGALLLAAPAAHAQAQRPRQGPNMTGTIHAPPYVLPGEPGPGAAQEPPALFTINGLPVRLSAPIEPAYDANANRNLAANPLWLDNNPPVPSMVE